MSKIKIFTTLAIVFFLVVGVVLYNAFVEIKRDYTVLKISDYGICFMISDDLSFKLNENGFTYQGKKNNGSFSFSKNDFDPDVTITENNGLEFGYKKIKNYRVYYYKVYQGDDFLMLTDKFEYVTKAPLNIVPYKKQCDEILKHHKKQIELEVNL